MNSKLRNAGVWPVVQRELRESARRPLNYWLRIGSALAGVFLFFSFTSNTEPIQAAAGLHIFTGLHTMLVALLCAVVPALTADCIASEKRDGTLGLLFLTPLSASGIVIGKALVKMIRAFTIWLAVMPVIVVPFLSGGVTGGDAFSAIAIEFCVMTLGLAAGLLASCLAKTRNTVYLLAVTLGVAFVFLFGQWLAFGLTLRPGSNWAVGQSLLTGKPVGIGLFYIASGPGFTTMTAPTYIMSMGNGRSRVITRSVGGPFGGFPIPALRMMAGTIGMPIGQAEGWSAYFTPTPAGKVWPRILWQSLAMAPLVFIGVMVFAAGFIERSWRDKIPSPQRAGWIKRYCLPVSEKRFARKMQRTLDWNPMAWLQQYSWKARLSKWGLCLAFVLMDCAATATGSLTDLQAVQGPVLLILAAVYTFVGVSSFLNEKKSGALELILVTPLPVNQIIGGRVWGLWKQFLPAGLTLLLFFGVAEFLQSSMHTLWGIYSSPVSWNPFLTSSWVPNYRPGSTLTVFIRLVAPLAGDLNFAAFVAANGFLTLPVFATYFALRVKNLIGAALLTWTAVALCQIAPLIIVASLALGAGTGLSMSGLYVAVLMSNLFFARLAYFLLRHSLSRRIYSF